MKIITVFHQEILLQKKVRNWNVEGAGGGKGYRGHTARSAVKASTLRLCAVEGTGGSPYFYEIYTIAHFKCAISITSLTHNCPLRGRFECAKV